MGAVMRRLAVLACLVAYGAALYQRPVNNDCLRNVDTSSNQASLFPVEFRITGDNAIMKGGATEVCRGKNGAGFGVVGP